MRVERDNTMDEQTIRNQLSHTLNETNFNFGEVYHGKVRDNYTIGNIMTMVTSDRLSAYDRIITTIPFKGQVLTQLALFWFNQTKDIVPNHVISTPDPNVMQVKKLKPLPIEAVVRAYITGTTSTSAWTNYAKGVRNFCGNILPEGLKKDQKLNEVIFTPSTKAEKEDHDESVSKEQILARTDLTEEQFEKVKEISMKLFKRGQEIAAEQGVILVDTKYEFGLDGDTITLMDEIHTPDSSRLWYADEYQTRFQAGEEQKRIDKDHLRTWLAANNFTGDGEVPKVPDEIRIQVANKYIEAYELITGQKFQAQPGDVTSRIRLNLKLLTDGSEDENSDLIKGIIKGIIKEIVNDSTGIKVTELVTQVYVHCREREIDIPDTGKYMLKLLRYVDDLVNDHEIIELDYVLLVSDYRIKSLYFPKGTKLYPIGEVETIELPEMRGKRQ